MVNGWCRVVQPDNIQENLHQQLCVFPYHFPGTYNTTELEELENKCKISLVTLLMFHFLNDNPIRCILMETVLACNGAMLSYKFLNDLASLCKKLSMSIILDEILTGGRTGSMLHWEKLPPNFKGSVAYITMGKWLGVGLILINPDHKSQYKQYKSNIRVNQARG